MSAPDEGERRATAPSGPSTPGAGDPAWDREAAPGGPRAVTHGCLCSVLANAAYRSGADEQPFVDPECPLHTRPAPITS